jgi:hypothetical protein
VVLPEKGSRSSRPVSSIGCDCSAFVITLFVASFVIPAPTEHPRGETAGEFVLNRKRSAKGLVTESPGGIDPVRPGLENFVTHLRGGVHRFTAMPMSHEKCRFPSSIPSVQPFPTTNTIPVGTMASADFCPVGAALKAEPLHPNHW